MKGQELLKDRMSYAELCEVFKLNNPAYGVNPNIIGRFAKKIGYKYAKQISDKKITYFYVKEAE